MTRAYNLLFLKGFTLVELMVTIAVLAIIAMIAAPSFSSILLNQKLKQAAIGMKVDIQQARSRAILTRSSTVVCPSTIDEATCGANITGYATLSTSQKKDSVLLVPIDSNISIKTGSATHFLFDPQGKTTEKTITLCGQNKSYVVKVFIPGTVEVTEGGACA